MKQITADHRNVHQTDQLRETDRCSYLAPSPCGILAASSYVQGTLWAGLLRFRTRGVVSTIHCRSFHLLPCEFSFIAFSMVFNLVTMSNMSKIYLVSGYYFQCVQNMFCGWPL